MRKYIYIGLGGALGAILRYLIKLNFIQNLIPLDTLLINIAGCFLLAFILTAVLGNIKFNKNLTLGISTGLIGAFTTFSAFCKETVMLMINGSYFAAIIYVILSILLGFAAAYFGFALASKIFIKKENRKAGLLPKIESENE